MSRTYRLFIYVFLATLSGFAPLITDMYLPALPTMANIFSTNPVMIQFSLTASMIGLALGQILVGPLSDKLGRLKPLRLSLILFLLATTGCIFAWDIHSFLMFRFIQGMAGAGGIVLSRSITTDIFHGQDLTKAFSVITAMNSIAPMLSPICGSILLEISDWRGIFMFLLLLGSIITILSFVCRESLAEQNRVRIPLLSTLFQFRFLFHNRVFILYTLLQGTTFGILFSYIAASPYIIQEHYGLSSLMFGIFFAVNAISMIGSSLLLPIFRNVKRALRFGCLLGIFMTICTASVLLSNGPFWLFEGCILLMLFFLSLIMPASTILAMNREKQRAGTASAFLGATLFAVGGIVSPLVGIGNVQRSTAIILLVCTVIISLLIFLIHYRPYTALRHRHSSSHLLP